MSATPGGERILDVRRFAIPGAGVLPDASSVAALGDGRPIDAGMARAPGVARILDARFGATPGKGGDGRQPARIASAASSVTFLRGIEVRPAVVSVGSWLGRAR